MISPEKISSRLHVTGVEVVVSSKIHREVYNQSS